MPIPASKPTRGHGDQEAIAAFEKASPLTQQDAGTLMSLAYAQEALGKTEEARKLVEEVEGTRRTHVSAHVSNCCI